MGYLMYSTININCFPLTLPAAYDVALNEMHTAALIIADNLIDPRWGCATDWQINKYTECRAEYLALRDLWLGF